MRRQFTAPLEASIAAIYRDDLVLAVVSGLTSIPLNLVEYQYDRQAEAVQMIDQNGTQHNYGIDGLGRQVSDTATVLGTNVDGAVRRIDTAYDFQGNVELTTMEPRPP
jgi:hypothetical protein